MASYSSSVQFGQTAFFGQLTPPPTPGSKDSDIIKHTANTGKLRRPKTPEPLLLLGVDYNILTKYLASTDSKAEDDAHPHDTTITSESAIASFAGISPLSANFIINNDVIEVSRPESYVPVESISLDATIASSKQHTAPTTTTTTTTLSRQKSTTSIPVSASIPINPARTNTITAKTSARLALSPINTAVTRTGSQRSFLIKRNQKLQKELPPPPLNNPTSGTTISAGVDPNSFPIPEPVATVKRSQSRMLRTIQSIGFFHSGSQTAFRSDSRTGSSACTEFAPIASQSHRSFSKRFMSGRMSKISDNGPPPSAHSNETSSTNYSRRLSHLQRRRNSVPEDPLAPVSVIPVMTNHEDVAGGLTYLPRYTNSFAGFCKSAWRLQLSDPKSFDIKNRNSIRGRPVLKCSKCLFAGPLHPQKIAGSRYVWARIPDSKVYSSFGVTYTWQFLFKSHLAQKKGYGISTVPSQNSHPQFLPAGKSGVAEIDMAEGLFGCIFCCVKGIGTPVFKGPESLSWHLRSHASDRFEDRELQHRFKVIIGREPEFKEKFDINIPHLVDGSNLGASVSVRVGGDGKWEEPGKISEESESSLRRYNADRVVAGPSSTPMLYLDIQNEKSWEVKLEGRADGV